MVNNYINSDDGLEYRTLDIDNDFLATIPDTADDKKLDDVLHEHQYKKRKEIRKKRERLLKKDFSRRKDYQSLLSDVVSLITKEGNLKLGQYVAHRKTIIDLLDKYLDWCEENNNYVEEATLHNLIFAMGGSHENTPYDSHNLWLLDDRLAFHRYIYSDKAVSKHKPKKGKTKSRLETDLAIYDINAYNSLKSRAKIEGFRETPYKSLMRLVENIYVEIMTYQTLLVNSRRRNKAFFKKLGIE